MSLGITISVSSDAGSAESPATEDYSRYYHGTDQASAASIVTHGLDITHASAFGSGDFWACQDYLTTKLYAHIRHQIRAGRGDAVVVGFNLPDALVRALKVSDPKLLELDVDGDDIVRYRFLAGAFSLLNTSLLGSVATEFTVDKAI
jgi:hypothetical protein